MLKRCICLGVCVLDLLDGTNPAYSQTLDAVEVDLELVLAADRSGSMSAGLRSEQRAGFAEAFRDPGLQQAIASGSLGRIAVLYFEWSDYDDQEVIIPWTLLESVEDMNRYANSLEHRGVTSGGGETSIAGAMAFARNELETNAYTAFRRVVDISGNGQNSSGPPVASELLLLRSVGATVNGLVLPKAMDGGAGPYDMLFSAYDVPMETYFQSEVIGGPGAFAIVVDKDGGFTDAILRKLVLEVAWNTREERLD